METVIEVAILAAWRGQWRAAYRIDHATKQVTLLSSQKEFDFKLNAAMRSMYDVGFLQDSDYKTRNPVTCYEITHGLEEKDKQTAVCLNDLFTYGDMEDSDGPLAGILPAISGKTIFLSEFNLDPPELQGKTSLPFNCYLAACRR